ncbi:MAG: FliH/SctL family protein [Sphingopyxis sp.]
MSKPLHHHDFADAILLNSFVVERGDPWFTPSPYQDSSRFAPRSADQGQDSAPPCAIENPLDAAFAAGHEQDAHEAAEKLAADIAALGAMLAQLPSLVPQPADALAKILALTVERLVTEIVGEVAINPDFMTKRIAQMAVLIVDQIGPVRLHVHPQDAGLVTQAHPDITLVIDAGRPRGSLLLETGAGWIEDGPQQRLAALRKQLESMEEAP